MPPEIAQSGRQFLARSYVGRVAWYFLQKPQTGFSHCVGGRAAFGVRDGLGLRMGDGLE